MHAILKHIEKDESPQARLTPGHHIELSQRALDEKSQKDNLYREYQHFQERFRERM